VTTVISLPLRLHRKEWMATYSEEVNAAFVVTSDRFEIDSSVRLLAGLTRYVHRRRECRTV